MNKANTKAEKIWIIILFIFIIGAPTGWLLYSHYWFNHHLIRPLNKEYRAIWVKNEKGEIEGWAEGRGFGAWRHFGKVFFINCALCSIVLGSGAYLIPQLFGLKGSKERSFSKGQREGRQEYEKKAREYAEEVSKLRMSADVQKGLQQEREVKETKKKLERILQEDEGLKKANENLRTENEGLKKTNRKLRGIKNKEENPQEKTNL